MHFFFVANVMGAAISSFNGTLGFQPDEYKVWYNKGDALANLGRYEEALACFDQALAIQPDAHAAWVFRGVVLVQLARYSWALASCEKALAINPNDKQAWIVRGAALNYLGQYKQAYASYDKALGVERQPRWQKLSQMLKAIFRIGHSSGTTSTSTVNVKSHV